MTAAVRALRDALVVFRLLTPPSPVDPNESSTYATLLKDDFSIAYADKTSAKGDYFNDAFTIGGSTLKNLTMGIGIDTDIPYGLLGVGYPANEAGVRAGKIQPYSNLPVQMVEEGFTNTVAFSMWLNDLGLSLPPLLLSTPSNRN